MHNSGMMIWLCWILCCLLPLVQCQFPGGGNGLGPGGPPGPPGGFGPGGPGGGGGFGGGGRRFGKGKGKFGKVSEILIYSRNQRVAIELTHHLGLSR